MKYFLWVVLPYSAFALFVAGHIWRYRRDRFGSDRLAPGALRIDRTGASLFRAGVLVVIIARVVVMLFPTLRAQPYGASHMSVAVCELLGMALAITGAVLLAVPHMIAGTQPQLVSPIDRLTVPILAIALISGLMVQFGSDAYLGGYRAAGTLFLWFPSLLTMHPQPDYMAAAPAPYQIRGLIIMLLIAIWPYTRLSGTLSGPIIFLASRSYHKVIPHLPKRNPVRRPRTTDLFAAEGPTAGS
ncbi:respiratory nitrate reductase subunit gamma [Nocardia sp. alder85J]|uniref:respiratory nitrate reductase subunit gamma n=1 Tax=Nocardia sp. alder85J TaxID=2862949 RepID=UPI001CD487AF|nr:respiratory nitrate reductase subunit gamma [Nocardia sp. alder85J]MCX4096080.1 respiratory nitrate reductase subunit gamma [Nocardia sp. alder85J]